ncbi:hypothetical protein BG015_008518 [Linnemannia schmuckeri]|uniref:Uncharacterized protein n=1 Tax=Linnemannia schmuckeri TaxID=64567 RepID=A0A9P5S6F1_9FUNG|nr:hypothetical protein BG015_008518 [Linnemannia schmuckeri]
MTNDDSSESSKKTIVIIAIAGGAALVAIVAAGFIIRHKRNASRRASAMEAYLSKKVKLRPMGNDNEDTLTSFFRNNNNGGDDSGQAENYHTVSPMLVRGNLASQDQYGQYYQQGHDYYRHSQEQCDEYYSPGMYSTGISTETTIDPVIRPSPTFVDFLFPPAPEPAGVPLAVDTSSKELSSITASPTFGSPGSSSLTSPLPRDPHSLIYSRSIASSSASNSRTLASTARTGMRNANGPSKRSPVEALITFETDEDTNGERPLRRSGSVLFE